VGKRRLLDKSRPQEQHPQTDAGPERTRPPDSRRLAFSGRPPGEAARGRSRFRLAVHGYDPEPDAPWIFGWNAEPLVTAPVAPNEAGRLPRFGSLLRVDPVGVAVLGLVPAEDGAGLILYLQDSIGVGRRVDVQPGLIRFSGGRLVDFRYRLLLYRCLLFDIL